MTHTTIYGELVEVICVEGCIATVMDAKGSFKDIHVTKIFEVAPK